MDYKLPDGSGLDVAERVRSKWDATPIILISGYDPSAVALRAEKLRISDFLEKPDWLFQGSIGIITGEPAVFSDDVRAHPDSIPGSHGRFAERGQNLVRLGSDI